MPLVSPEPEEPVPVAPPVMPNPSQEELPAGGAVLPSAGLMPTWGVGLEEPSVVVVVVFVVVVVVPPSGTVSPTFTVVPRAQHAPVKRARQIINASFIRIARIISRMPILRLALKRFANPERI